MPASLGGIALALLSVSLLAAWAGGIPWTLVLLASAYVGELALRRGDGSVDASAPLVAAALLLLAELAYWSLELRAAGRAETRLLLRRLAALAALAFGAVLLGMVVLVVTALPFGGGAAWHAVGVAAAAGALAILARLARKT